MLGEVLNEKYWVLLVCVGRFKCCLFLYVRGIGYSVYMCVCFERSFIRLLFVLGFWILVSWLRVVFVLLCLSL